MAIRFPLTSNQVVNNGIIATGPASTAGGVGTQFNIPQDADNIVIKTTASILGGGMSVTLQTTDDGGTTWYDVARTSIVSNANGTTAEWLSVPVTGIGVKTTYVSGTVPSVGGQAAASIYAAIGTAAASTLGQLAVSGMPLLSTRARIFQRYTAAVTSIIAETVTVYTNSQSPNT